MVHKVVSAVTALALCVSLGVSALAAKSETVSVTLNRQIAVTYDGVKQAFSDVNGIAVYPITYQGTTYLPVRAMSGLVGLNIAYNDKTNTVELASGGQKRQEPDNGAAGRNETVTVLLNRELKVTFDGKEQTFADANGAAVYPITYQGTTYLPVRAISNLMALPVSWDQAANTVVLGKGAAPQTGGSAQISSDWTAQEFILDGTKLALPAAYQTLKDMGWYADFSGYSDGGEDYVLKPGDKVSCTIDLKNSKYDPMFVCWIGFENNTSAPQTLRSCDVWSIRFERVRATGLLTNVPDLVVTGGLTWGSTMAEVKTVLGEPMETYRSDTFGSTTLSYYNETFESYFKVTVYDDSGVGEVQLQSF